MFTFKPTRKNLTFLAAGVAALIVISSLVPFVRSPALTVSKYPLAFLTFLRREAGAFIFFHGNFRECERLRKEADALKYKLNLSQEAFLENKRLKGLLAFKQKSRYRVTAARVIARSPESWSSVIIIDKGTKNGIRRGSVALTSLALVGKVIEASATTSKIMLLNDVNLGVSALVQRSRQEGLVSGTLGNSLIMKYLPKESDVQVEDTVLTSGLTDAYPKGLLIGTVTEVGEEFSGLSRYAVIKPAANLLNVEEVLVIIP